MADAALQEALGQAANFDLASLLSGADPLGDLVAFFGRSLIQVNEGGLLELLFIEQYAGKAGVTLVARMLELKAHQTPGAKSSILELAKALSLYDFLKGFNIGAIGGGGSK